MRSTLIPVTRRRSARLACAVAGFLALFGQGGCDSDDPAPVVIDRPASGPSLPDLPALPTTAPVLTVSGRPTAGDDPTSLDVKGALTEDKYLAKIIQTVVGFDHPQGLAFSLDQKVLYVTNTAATSSAGMRQGGGSVSSLAVGDDGRLRMIKPALATGLTAPTGIAVLPRPTRRFPAGALFVATGTANVSDDQGVAVTDIAVIKPGVTILHPDTGATLGFIPLGPKTAVVKSLFGDAAARIAIVAPAGLEFGADGDLYVCNSDNTRQNVDPPLQNRPGILRVRHRDIDAYAANAPAGDVSWLGVRYVPVSILFTPIEGGHLFWACAGEGAAGGSVWMTSVDTFAQESMVKNVIGAVGPLGGVAINRRGACFMSRLDGDLVFINHAKVDSVRFIYEDQPSFATPGAIRFLSLPTGETVLYLPEQDPGPIDHKQRLRVILMPGSF